MSEENLTQAKAAVERLLIALDVVKVVNVDDENDDSVALEDVLASAQNLESEILQSAFPELGNSIPGDTAVLTAKIRQEWERLEPKIRSERGQAVVDADRKHNGEETDDLEYSSILKQIIPNEKLINLSPAEWDAQQDSLLQSSKDQRTLFLFDQDFSRVGGDRNGGIKIIASLLAKEDNGSLICGLLTHTVKPETQPEQWEALSDEHGITQDRFIVIPKQHLSEMPILFAQSLKFTALSPDFAELKQKTQAIITAAAIAAGDRVKEIRIHDLDHIVFRVSANEGLWEPDMLFRLHAMFHRLESRRLAHVGGTLEAITARLRDLSGIPTSTDLPTPASAWALQREELYEFDDHINKNHLPLELGDIFEKVGGESASMKKYILLAQPCDLMVRRKGVREPDLHQLPLVEVVIKEKEPDSIWEEMPYFDESPSKRWYVLLKRAQFVRASILDLCVFNQDGLAKQIVDGSVPAGMRPAWKERHDILSRYWKKVVCQADMYLPGASDTAQVRQLKEKITKDIGPLLFKDNLFKGTLEDADGVRSLTYNCKRIGRLSSARAFGLLMSYTATLGRPAYDRDFG